MPRAVYVDCFSGASGDMLLGALLDAGVPLDSLRQGLASLAVAGYELTAERVQEGGLTGTRARVQLDGAKQPRRRLSDILTVLGESSLPKGVADRAATVFERLAEVEAAIHGTTVEEVHFHEVGAVDAIVDVVGVVLGMHLLGAEWEQVYCSGLPLGDGWVRASHGPLPVPAPATLELLRRAGAPTRRAPPGDGATGELTTPTGAALLTTLARFEQPPLGRVDCVGYGFGGRSMPWPNAVRLWAGEVQSAVGLLRDSVVHVETNLDDATPEELGFAMERLLEAGALDVAFSPLQMKKNRPGVLVRVLARPSDAQRLVEVLLTHTSALGARVQTIERLIARRRERVVETPWGAVRVKEKLLGERVVAAPEYEDCARLAREAGVTLREVYAAAVGAGSG
jgi:pyridinium-3,5-bisthiocarboxylic acid mononucleotide nickel chelatase